MLSRLLVESDLEESQTITVKGDEYHYLSKVRRNKIGDSVEIVDRSGNRFKGSVEAIDSASAKIKLEERLEKRPEAYPIHLLVAVPKGSLFDDVVRKVNELGASRITPVICERTVVKPSDAKVERWQRIALESCRQCRRRAPIVVDSELSLEDAVKEVDKEALKIVLHPDDKSVSFIEVLQRVGKEKLVIAVGPEGGFAEDEISILKKEGFDSASLGPFILRIETAAIAAAAIASAIMTSK